MGRDESVPAMTFPMNIQSRSWFFWIMAVLCGAVNLALLAEILSTLTTKSNLAQLEMDLLLTFVLFGLPVIVVSLIVVIFLIRKRSGIDDVATRRQPLRLKLAVSGVNLAIPLIFLLFFISVKVFGYYWT